MTPATACGKVILLGEHAVVYGRPALAAGIENGADAVFEPDVATGTLRLAIEPWGTRVERGNASDLGRALASLVAALPFEVGGACGTIRATVRLPGGGGLGSSAALGVATARALGRGVLARDLTMDETLAGALAWERVFHGNPSGVDHTMASHGGAGTFSRAEGFRAVSVRTAVRLVVADTGERAPTKDMVASVARIHARRLEATEKTFDAIAALVRNGVIALAAGDLRALGQLMDMNQALLSSLMLSTERTEELCRAAREAGAWGAKLTGGGGGGCVISLAGDRETEVTEAFRVLGAPSFVAEIAAQ